MATPRRRLSGRMSIGGGRLSFGGNSVHTGRTSVGTDLGVNDDDAEKRRRRARRKSFGAPLARTPAGGDGPTNAQIANMYQTALKLSTENKINQKNTWSLSLIDHIGELCSGQQADTAPDFQKASCTLDASVKIYSYRVDDVWTSSFRVLENLNRTGKHQSAEAAAASNKGASKKLHVAHTLEKNIGSITVKKFDMEFDVDPLFHKMSKAFDEGGARGMLLNNLSVHDGCNLVFDSVDVGDVDAGESDIAPSQQAHQEEVPVDVAPLRAKLQAGCDHGDLASLSHMSLCPSLGWLYGELARARRAEAGGDAPGAGDGQSESKAAAAAAAAESSDDEFDEFDGNYMDEGGLAEEGDYHDGGGFMLAPAANAGSGRSSLGSGRHSVGSGRAWDAPSSAAGVAGKPQTAAAQAAATLCDAVALSTPQNAEYSYFDTARLSKLHHWAGPSHAHWKAGRKATVPARTAAGTKAKKPKAKKAKVTIDFFAPPIDTEVAFAPPPRSATATMLSAAALKKNEEAAESLLLPEDHGYKLSDLLKLSSKRGKVVVLPKRNALGMGNDRTGELLAVGVAQDMDMGNEADNFVFDNHANAGDYDEPDDYDDGGGFMLNGSDDLDTTVIAGSASGAGFGANLEGFLVEKADRVDKIDIKYATVAKKVDVKKLKDHIWEHVSQDAPAADAGTATADDDDATSQDHHDEGETKHATTAEGVSFQGTVAALAPSAPASITVPFYFICMLHLANEKGLALHPSGDLTDFRVSTETGSEDRLAEEQ